MPKRTRPSLVIHICSVYLAFFLTTGVVRGEWPEHRGNVQRTGFVLQLIKSQSWNPGWVLSDFNSPVPAWPEAARGSLWQRLDKIEPRVTDDYGNVPLIVTDNDGQHRVLVASSANDRLICVNAEDGSQVWEFVAQAPIRFAPSVMQGVAFLAADDGHVRAIRITDGAVLWDVKIGPDMPWIPGNQRLISPHPVRTSATVIDGLVYACAGLFPGQGVYAVALQATDGRIVWRRRIDQSPQVYLVGTDDDRFIVPSGRGVPFLMDALNGRLLEKLPSPGGSFCMLTPDAFFAGPGNLKGVESFPRTSGMALRTTDQGKPQMLPFGGRAVAAGSGKIWIADGSQLICYNAARILNQQDEAVEWTVDCQLDQTLIVSGTDQTLRLFVADQNQVLVFDALTGKQLTSATLESTDEQIMYLAVSGQQETNNQQTDPHPIHKELLVATTSSGRIYCWHGSDRAADPSENTPAIKSAAESDNTDSRWTSNSRLEVETSVVEDDQTLTAVGQYLDLLPVDAGLVLVTGDSEGKLCRSLAKQSRFQIINVLRHRQDFQQCQSLLHQHGLYGHRVTVRHVPDDQPLPFATGIFNAIIQIHPADRTQQELTRLLVPDTGWLFPAQESPISAPGSEDSGFWRHQYGSPANEAAAQDAAIGTATDFQLQWFGGVGPRRMPDRHLRGPAPLAAGSALIMQADERLIGVDPANGFERWQLDLPKDSMRYVTPFDCGYCCLTKDGRTLYAATSESIWKVDALRGQVTDTLPMPEIEASKTWGSLRFGYLAECNEALLVTCMKSSAPRLALDPVQARLNYSDQDYNSQRPLVCSRMFARLTPDGAVSWNYVRGTIVNSSITVAESQSRILFVEGRSDACLQHESDRIPLPVIMQDAFLICLDAGTGQAIWEQRIEWPEAKNMLFTQTDGKLLAIVSSASDEQAETAGYQIRVHQLQSGELVWQAQHQHIRKGLYHGEQIHHPVILRQPDQDPLLVVEPYLYDLKTGVRRVPTGAEQDWSLRRPGHSCGSLSGAGQCLFFRATNPTFLNLHSPQPDSYSSLAPSRPGCWINIIPAHGRLLIPEASASCVCSFPLQTSMAFTPGTPVLLDDVEVTSTASACVE